MVGINGPPNTECNCIGPHAPPADRPSTGDVFFKFVNMFENLVRFTTVRQTVYNLTTPYISANGNKIIFCEP